MSKWAVNWKTVGKFAVGGAAVVAASIPIRKLRQRGEEAQPSGTAAVQQQATATTASPPQAARHPTPQSPTPVPTIADVPRQSVNEEQFDVIVKNVEEAKEQATEEFKKAAWEKAAKKYLEARFLR